MDPNAHIGPYRLLEPLGKGGMGVVYRAVHVETGVTAALKTVRVPREGLLQSIRREIHALASLQHPGIVHILDEGIHDGLPWYAMELLDGTTLRDWAPAPRDVEPHGAETQSVSASTLSELHGDGDSSNWWTRSATRTIATPATREPAGGDASRLAREAVSPAGSLERRPLAAILTLVRRLCAPLAFLHGEGILHRDLKPENILVTRRRDLQPQPSMNGLSSASRQPSLELDWPVLVDFGLVSRFGGELSREALDTTPGISGTVAYMAPEQLLGELTDARADLYSLGCILYELVTQRRPFLGSTFLEVAKAQLHSVPKRPSELVDGVPAGLDALILRLLSKRPRERLGYADDVAAALASLAGDDEMACGIRPRPYLYRSGFAGRTDALGQLLDAVSRLENGSGSMVLIGGESGAGKTRLMLELTRKCKDRDIEILTGGANLGPPALDSIGGRIGVPLQPLRPALEAIADRCRAQGVETAERLLGSRGKLLGRYEPALTTVPGQDAYPEPAELPPASARKRVLMALTETLAALAENRPVLLVLDDLQWADELTASWLEHLVHAERFRDLRLLVVGTYRSEEVGALRDAPLARILEAPSLLKIELGRMEEAAVGSIVADMLALQTPPSGFVGYLTQRSGGSPFFVAEYLRTAVAEGMLTRDVLGLWQVADGTMWLARPDATRVDSMPDALPLPSSLRDLVSRRLDRLSQAALTLVERLCVLGREFDEALLERMNGAELESLEALRELVARQVLEDTDPNRMRFLHDQIREVAYQRLDSSRRSELHRRAAEAMTASYGADRSDLFASLARHWELGGVIDKARDGYLRAARHSVSRFALVDAESLFRAHLSLVERPTVSTAMTRNEFSRLVLQPLGKMPEAREQYQAAFDEAAQLGDFETQGRSLQGLAQITNLSGNPEAARSLAMQALELYRTTGNRTGEGQVVSFLGRLAGQEGRLEDARAHLLTALGVLRGLHHPRAERVVLSNLGILARKQAKLDEARDFYQAALSATQEEGDRIDEAVVLNNLACVESDQGHFEAARKLFERACSLNAELGSRPDELIALGNLAHLEHLVGNLEIACRNFEKAFGILKELERRDFSSGLMSDWASCLCDLGRVEEALALYEKSLAIAQSCGSPEAEGKALRGLGTLQRWMGATEQAERLLEAAESRCQAAGEVLSIGLSACDLGHLALSCNRPARPFLDRARQVTEPVGASSASEIGMSLGRLERAIEAFEQGRPLFHGQLAEGLPEALRRWLESQPGIR